MKKRSSNVILIVMLLIGLSLLLYPSLSNYWNSLHSTQVIASYTEQVVGLDRDAYDGLWEAARAHNRTLAQRTRPMGLSDTERERYNALLNVGGAGVMGYIEIERIGVSLPIYHGTDDAVLQSAVGHLEWSSLPAGGESTHCVLSGHRGLPSAKLFTHLDQLEKGDTFLLRILDETLTYEVDQIRIVEPHEVEELGIVAGEDLCTLVTCTPYGINTHRLLVRGHRVENAAAPIHVTADALQIDPLLVAPLVALPMLLALLAWVLLRTGKKS